MNDTSTKQLLSGHGVIGKPKHSGATQSPINFQEVVDSGGLEVNIPVPEIKPSPKKIVTTIKRPRFVGAESQTPATLKLGKQKTTEIEINSPNEHSISISNSEDQNNECKSAELKKTPKGSASKMLNKDLFKNDSLIGEVKKAVPKSAQRRSTHTDLSLGRNMPMHRTFFQQEDEKPHLWEVF